VTNEEQPVSLVSKQPQLRKQRRPGPAEPHYGISPTHWPDVLRRLEQGHSLRQIARDYGVSYETVRRTVRVARRKEGK
jgi:hypothetical protein